MVVKRELNEERPAVNAFSNASEAWPRKQEGSWSGVISEKASSYLRRQGKPWNGGRHPDLDLGKLHVPDRVIQISRYFTDSVLLVFGSCQW